MKTPPAPFAGLDLLASAVLILDAEVCIAYANPAAENLLESSLKSLLRQPLAQLFQNGEEPGAGYAARRAQHQFADQRQDLTLERTGREPLQVHCIVTALDDAAWPVLIELRENVQQLQAEPRRALARPEPGQQGTDPQPGA